MQSDTNSVRCGNCGLQLDEDASTSTENRLPCPACNSLTRAIDVSVYDEVTTKERLGMKGRHRDGGKPFIEQVHGADWHRDTRTWRHIDRIIDRENDKYYEVVKDPKTGEILHECQEPLSKHRDHGAAKHKLDKKKDGEQPH